jgi:hypothetical protein
MLYRHRFKTTLYSIFITINHIHIDLQNNLNYDTSQEPHHLGKSRYGDKEYTREQKLTFENKRLKRENDRLRKALSRLDLDRYSQIRDIIEEHYQDEREEEGQKILNNIKKDWKCYFCESGTLVLVKFTKQSGEFYIRKCNSCEHRTKSQKWTPDIK